jgi:aspartate kinase
VSSFTTGILTSNIEAKSTLIALRKTKNGTSHRIGIAFNRDEAKISVLGVPDTPGIAYQILGAVADANIEADVIIQNISKEGKPTSVSPSSIAMIFQGRDGLVEG